MVYSPSTIGVTVQSWVTLPCSQSASHRKSTGASGVIVSASLCWNALKVIGSITGTLERSEATTTSGARFNTSTVILVTVISPSSSTMLREIKYIPSSSHDHSTTQSSGESVKITFSMNPSVGSASLSSIASGSSIMKLQNISDAPSGSFDAEASNTTVVRV